jgi:hypothetical protein
MNIHHAEPDCNFYIAKVCVDLEPQGSPVENVLKVGQIQPSNHLRLH